MREKERVTRVFYVRHGEAEFPLDRIYCDLREDPPLTEKGRRQAQAAAEFLSSMSLDAVYSSPSARTCETAQKIAQGRDQEIVVEAALCERCFGVWEGMYFHEIEARYPDEYQAWKLSQADFRPEQGESVFDMLERVQAAVSRIINEHRGESVVIVAHVGPIRALICDALKIPLAEYRRLMIEPASVSCIDYGFRQNNLIFMNFSERLFSWGAAQQGHVSERL